MNKDTVEYLFRYYSTLLGGHELLAMKHQDHSIKLENRENEDNYAQIVTIYKRVGWLTDDENVLDLLKEGNEPFKIEIANRILKKHADKIFFNRCPKCNGLARTPYAKQCRHCFYSWH